MENHGHVLLKAVPASKGGLEIHVPRSQCNSSRIVLTVNVCDEYHTGEYCQLRKCLKDCSVMVCLKDFIRCAPGFKGEDCSKTTCGHSCGKHGKCVVDDDGLSAKEVSWNTGGQCELIDCHGRGV